MALINPANVIKLLAERFGANGESDVTERDQDMADRITGKSIAVNTLVLASLSDS